MQYSYISSINPFSKASHLRIVETQDDKDHVALLNKCGIGIICSNVESLRDMELFTLKIINDCYYAMEHAHLHNEKQTAHSLSSTLSETICKRGSELCENEQNVLLEKNPFLVNPLKCETFQQLLINTEELMDCLRIMFLVNISAIKLILAKKKQ